jgi:hypothetical protein
MISGIITGISIAILTQRYLLMPDNIRDLLVRGVAAAKANQEDEARFFLEWLLRLDPPEDECIEACYWLSEVSSDPAEKRRLLEETLARRPSDYRARRSLAVLEGRLNPQEIVNPDRLMARAEQGPVAAQRFECPQCGGRLTFTPDGSSLTCEYCSRNQVLATSQTGKDPGPAEMDFTVALATAQGHVQPIDMRTFECQACAARFLLPPQAISLTCPYCVSVYVIEAGENKSVIPPESVIPFVFPASEAQQLLRKFLAFRKRRDPITDANLHGLYLPVWKFTISGYLPWEGREYQHGEWKTASGQKLILYDDILVLATHTLPEVWSEEVKRFHYHLAVPYDPAYLADWPAETYQITLSDASLKARWQALERLRKSLNHEQTGPINDLKVNSMDLLIQSFQFILVPIWIAHLKDGDQPCSVLINGQTGEIRAQLARSEKRGLLSWLLD